MGVIQMESRHTTVSFNWDTIQYKGDGKVLLLYRHERIFEEKLFKMGMKCADIGGWGHLSERIRQEGGECIVLDKFTEDQYFPNRIANEPHMIFDVCAPLEPLMENSYNLVTCFEVLEHVDDQVEAIKNMYKMLKSGGYLAGTFPIPGGTHPANDPTVHFISEEVLRTYMSNTGFVDIITEPTPSINSYDPDRPSFYFKGRKP